MVFKKDFTAEAFLASICTDPTDARRICIAGTKGALNVLRFSQAPLPTAGTPGGSPTPPNSTRGEVKLADSQTYQVDVKPGDALVCRFAATRDLLYVLLPREVGCRRTVPCLCTVAAAVQSAAWGQAAGATHRSVMITVAPW